MNVKAKLLAIALACACGCGRNGAQAQQPAGSTTTSKSPITGVWRAQMDGLPAIVLVITDEAGALNGAVLFYFHERKTVNDPYTSTPGLPEPMFQIHFEGKSLEFQVSHRRAHPPRTLNDPPVSFRLTLTGPNQAELVNESEKGPGMVLTQTEY